LAWKDLVPQYSDCAELQAAFVVGLLSAYYGAVMRRVINLFLVICLCSLGLVEAAEVGGLPAANGSGDASSTAHGHHEVHEHELIAADGSVLLDHAAGESPDDDCVQCCHVPCNFVSTSLSLSVAASQLLLQPRFAVAPFVSRSTAPLLRPPIA